MWHEAKITGYDGEELRTVPTVPIDRELLQKQAGYVEFRIVDGREITKDQRKKIFAIIRDVANFCIYEPADARNFLTWDFCEKYEIEPFSLSNVDRTTAGMFIDYLIDFCFTHNIPTRKPLIEQSQEIGRYLYLCLEHRKCAICNDPAEVHHVDRIGMGRDREKIVHVGLRAIALCHKHHDEAHAGEKELFGRYHVYGIKLDRYLCDCLNLNTKERKGHHETNDRSTAQND